MTAETRLKIVTGREDRPITGTDSTILFMPDRYYVDVDGDRALAVKPFSDFLRLLAESQAAELGEVLHHAEFEITRSPAVVRAWGQLHDCERCREGVANALAVLETTDKELVVGQLWWAG